MSPRTPLRVSTGLAGCALFAAALLLGSHTFSTSSTTADEAISVAFADAGPGWWQQAQSADPDPDAHSLR